MPLRFPVLALSALLLLALPSTAQEASSSDGPVTIREHVVLPTAGSNGGELFGGNAAESERAGGGIAGYVRARPAFVPYTGTYGSLGGPMQVRVEVEIRRPSGTERRGQEIGPAFPLRYTQELYECTTRDLNPRAEYAVEFYLTSYTYHPDGAFVFELPIRQRDALPDTEIRARVFAVDDTISLGVIRFPSESGVSWRTNWGGRVVVDGSPTSTRIQACRTARGTAVRPLRARFGVEVEAERTAPRPTFIAEPTASPDSLRRGEASTIGLEVVGGDGSTSDMDDSALASLALSSTELGELYLDGDPQGASVDSIAAVDVIAGRVQFVAKDEPGLEGTVRVSSTVSFNGESGSGYADIHVVPDQLHVLVEPETVGLGEQARIRIEGRSFRDEPVVLDPQTLITLDLHTGRYGSLFRESDESKGSGVAADTPTREVKGGESVARDVTLFNIPLEEFETDPVWFRVQGESPPADTAVAIVATSEHYVGDGEVVVEGGGLDHLAVFFETPERDRSDTLRYGERYGYVVVEGRTAEGKALWLDPSLTLELTLSPAVEPFADAYTAFYDAMDGTPKNSYAQVVTPPSLLLQPQGNPSVLRVEALRNPIGEEPQAFTVTVSVQDSAAVGPAERTGYVAEDYFLNLIAEPDRLRPGARAALRLEAISKRSLQDMLALPAETAFDLSVLAGQFAPGGVGVGEEEPTASAIAVTAEQFAAGQVWYRAPDSVPEGDTTDAAVDGVNLVVQRSGDAFLRGEEQIEILPQRCDLNWTHYTQGDVRWGSDRYGRGGPATIRGSGCALTTFAMAATALGGEITPGELNDAMKERLGFINNLVVWDSAAVIVRDSVGVKVVPSRNDDVWMYASLENPDASILNVAERSPNHVLDYHVNNCKPVSVQVYNHNSSNSRREHWVMVVGKEDGRYRILDPAGSHSYLDEYGGDDFPGWFWGYTSYEVQR